jgi:trehalose 6-phosphate phosphatase
MGVEGFGLRTESGTAGLAAILADPAGAVIASDFDGTLSPIVDVPEAAHIHPDAPEVLIELGRKVGAIVIVTGRPVAQAIELGRPPGGGPGLADVPGLVVLGQYGVERWENGAVAAPPPPPGLDRVRAALPELIGGLPGARIEDKGRALAVHTRNCADPDGALRSLADPVAKLAAETGLVVEPGRMVLELRPPGMDKGQALRAFLEERSARSVLFAGDDLGDVAAFDAVHSGDLPGVALCSASPEVSAALTDRADAIVEGPAGVIAFLRALAARL